MDNAQLIHIRRREIEDQLARLQAEIDALQAEKAELDITERVLAKLAGAEWRSAGPADQSPTPSTSGGGAETKRMPRSEMVISVLSDAYERQGQTGLTPKDIGERIANKFKVEVKPRDIASLVWRMWIKQGRLSKIGEGVYGLPQKENPEGEVSGKDAPSGLFGPSRPVEPVPGGGT